MVSPRARAIEYAIKVFGGHSVRDIVLPVGPNAVALVNAVEMYGAEGSLSRMAEITGLSHSSMTKLAKRVAGEIDATVGALHVPPPVEQRRKRNAGQKANQAEYHKYRRYVAKHDHMRALIRQLKSENKKLRKVISDKPETTICRKCYKSFDRQGGKQPTRLEQLAGSTRRDRRKVVQGFARRIIELRRGGEQ